MFGVFLESKNILTIYSWKHLVKSICINKIYTKLILCFLVFVFGFCQKFIFNENNIKTINFFGLLNFCCSYLFLVFVHLF